MTATLIRCTEEVKTLLGKLPDFKRDRTLHEHIITINTMEEEGDRLFLACMRNCMRPALTRLRSLPGAKCTTTSKAAWMPASMLPTALRALS